MINASQILVYLLDVFLKKYCSIFVT